MLRIKERKSTDQTEKGQNAENHVTMETYLFLGAIIFVDTVDKMNHHLIQQWIVNMCDYIWNKKIKRLQTIIIF